MRGSALLLLLLELLQRADGHVLPISARAAQSRALHIRMQDVSSWPPPLDAVHVFNVNGNAQMALAELSADKRGVLAFWRFLYEHEAGGEPSKLAKARAELQCDDQQTGGGQHRKE